ncbi:MAG: adenylosuccinate synthase [Sphaerochaetaceae bacterium]|nr:adenylosuccinate synthase [Sphaerochaetaceae bacterium]
MSVTAIVGAQWGDEGKGRVVDYLAQKADMVIRFQGGDNAGHTVINDAGKFALHIVPSGIFNPETVCIVGAGTVVNFNTMSEELDAVQAKGVLTDNLFIDRRAHLILPYHRLLDGAEEESKKGGLAAGTTKRGVGPAYSDKVNRVGIRASDILDETRLRKLFEAMIEKKNRDLAHYDLPLSDVDSLMALCASWKERYGDKIIDTVPLIKHAIENNKDIVLEGQLGIMRDIDWGIYPYSTSSNPTAGGATSGAGISPRRIDEVIGVVKVYSTSVGGGPFPTELLDATGEKLRSVGSEFGATTGRPRRCGWFDAVAASFSCWINGFTHIALTKLDILDTFEELKICTGYMIDGQLVTDLPDTIGQEKAEPVYETWEGWMESTEEARTWNDLPAKAQAYLNRLAELTGAQIRYISVGPERDQIIIM